MLSDKIKMYLKYSNFIMGATLFSTFIRIYSFWFNAVNLLFSDSVQNQSKFKIILNVLKFGQMCNYKRYIVSSNTIFGTS